MSHVCSSVWNAERLRGRELDRFLRPSTRLLLPPCCSMCGLGVDVSCCQWHDPAWRWHSSQPNLTPVRPQSVRVLVLTVQDPVLQTQRAAGHCSCCCGSDCTLLAAQSGWTCFVSLPRHGILWTWCRCLVNRCPSTWRVASSTTACLCHRAMLPAGSAPCAKGLAHTLAPQ